MGVVGRYIGMILLLAAMALASAPAVGAAESPFLDVIVVDRFFERSQGGPSLRVRMRDELLVDVLVYDESGRCVFVAPGKQAARKHEIQLGGLPQVDRGVYLFCLAASDGSKKRAGLYPDDPGGGQIVKVDDSVIDARQNQIRYLLPRSSFVRIRAGVKDGPYLDPILPWQPQASGRHALPWDGTVQGGIFKDLHRHPDAQVIVSAVSLPQNILIDTGATTVPSGDVPVSPEVTLPEHLEGLATPPWPSLLQNLGADGGMPVAADYRLTLDAELKAAEQLATIRIDCHPDDRAALLNQRFEIMVFGDALFITEDERGILPFTYEMTTRGITPGLHQWTVNIIDSKGRLGTASREITIPDRRKGEPHE